MAAEPTHQAPPASADTALEPSLYERAQKIYPREVHGIYALLRTSGVAVLLGLFYGVAWISWNGQQALLFDLPARKFHIFGLTLWPQDFFLLALILILAALALFFFTALAGRLWCGYACPQTVWTEAFLWMERKIEGDRMKQMRLDKEPWGPRKFRIKATKHLAWIAFAAWTGFTFVGYFTPIRELGERLVNATLGPWETFWVVFYGFATYGNAGWMREQVCKYMCPYARFQSAMFDDDTLIVSYDPGRGEPRGARRRGVDYKGKGLGDCVDCTLCVQVCPTGIDIRNGLQYECIACSACIDACNDVMGKMSYPKGLIRFTTQNAVDGKPTRIVRPRILVYGALLLAFSGLTVYQLASRLPLAIDVLRDRNQLFRDLPDGRIENVYTLKLMNMEGIAHDYAVTASGIDGLELIQDSPSFRVGPGEVVEAVVRLRADPANLSRRSVEVVFSMQGVDHDGPVAMEHARFVGPQP